jgi:hypothetical protein
VQSRFERPREPSILVAVIAAFLLIALIKPWSFGENGSDSGRPGPPVAIPSGSMVVLDVEPSLGATPSILDPNAMACLTDATEQVVIIERWAGHEVRSWVAVADMTVSGPLDERLVAISIFSSHVIGLGVCAPRARAAGQQPAARLLDVRSIIQTASGPLAVDLGKLDPITLQPSGPEPAILYGAPVVPLPGVSPGPTDGLATWPTAAYAIAFRFPSDGSNAVRWLRIDLIEGAGESG